MVVLAMRVATMSYQPNRCKDGKLVVPFFTHQLSIAVEATASHALAEATIGKPIDRARWWRRWAHDRSLYRAIVEDGGMFPPAKDSSH